jgi:hypothetical protein
MSGDEISLTLPGDEAFHPVAHLVLGGLAVRLDLTYENLEDLELAIDTLLEQSRDDQDVTVRVRVPDDELVTVVGPVTSVRGKVEDDAEGSLSVRRILDTVCDSVDVVDRDGGEWVELHKRTETVKDASA